MNHKLKPQSSSLWIYNSTVFSSRSILTRIFFILFLILDLFLIVLFCSYGNLLLVFPYLSLIVIFYIFISISFKLYVK